MTKKRRTADFLTAMLACAVLLAGVCGANGAGAEGSFPWGAGAFPDFSYSEKLDAAFTGGKVTFTRAEPRLPDPATCRVAMPPEDFWESFNYEYDEAYIRRQLTESLRIIGYSPDGSTMVGVIRGRSDNERFSPDPDIILAIASGTVTVMYPSDRRGYGELKWIVKNDYPQIAGTGSNQSVNKPDSSGMIWSPDGRYFCPLGRIRAYGLAYYKSSLKTALNSETSSDAMAAMIAQSNFCDALCIADTRTGEMFAVDFFGANQNFRLEPEGKWSDGFFSEDGQAFYTLLWASGENSHTRKLFLVRHDLNTGERRVMETGLPDMNPFMPGTLRLRDGRFIGITQANPFVPEQNLIRFDEKTAEETTELKILNKEGRTYIRFQVDYIAGSAKTGEALAAVSNAAESINKYPYLLTSGLLHIRAGNPGTDTDTLWVLPEGSRRLKPVTAVQIEAIWTSYKELDSESRENSEYRYQRICDIQVSPDGRYALLSAIAYKDKSVTTIIVRLGDMACVPAEGLTAYTASELAYALNSHDYLFNWSEAGILVTGTGELYRIE